MNTGALPEMDKVGCTRGEGCLFVSHAKNLGSVHLNVINI